MPNLHKKSWMVSNTHVPVPTYFVSTLILSSLKQITNFNLQDNRYQLSHQVNINFLHHEFDGLTR